MKKVKSTSSLKLNSEELFESAMKQHEKTFGKWIADARAEAVRLRLENGLDANGGYIKEVELDEEGKVIKKKRGPKPKVKTETIKETVKFERVKSAPKNTAKKKTAKKKEKGRKSSAPILQFDGKINTFQKKVNAFDESMSNLFGKKYTGKKLTVDDIKMEVLKMQTKPTSKNPKGVLLVTLSTDKLVAKFYEWDKKFWMAQVVNFPHYMKPIKKTSKK